MKKIDIDNYVSIDRSRRPNHDFNSFFDQWYYDYIIIDLKGLDSDLFI
jgi:hypothetical protein